MPSRAAAIRGRIRGTTRDEDLAEADLVVEAVFEDLAVKKAVFARLDRACRAETILATNTSSFAVAELAAGTPHPERVLGLHYFYHPAKNRLVEVVAGPATHERHLHRAWALQETLGKTPIRSRDAKGFIVNRFFSPWLNEAVRLLEEGVADVATIDAAARKAFGIGMGPFELMNVTGVPDRPPHRRHPRGGLRPAVRSSRAAASPDRVGRFLGPGRRARCVEARPRRRAAPGGGVPRRRSARGRGRRDSRGHGHRRARRLAVAPRPLRAHEPRGHL